LQGSDGHSGDREMALPKGWNDPMGTSLEGPAVAGGMELADHRAFHGIGCVGGGVVF